MAETAKYAMESEMGCGFVGAFFQLKGLRTKNSFLFQASPKSAKTLPEKGKSSREKPIPARPSPSNYSNQSQGGRVSDAARKSSSSSSNNSAMSNKSSQLVSANSYNRRLTKELPTFTSSELSLTLADQRKLDGNGSLYRGSTGNVMLLSHLGNVKQAKRGSTGDRQGVVVKGNAAVETGYRLGNIVRSSPTNKLNPEVIKSLGNDKYKQGKYEEALALYNQSISIDPSKACYYSNKSAALMELGRLVEAVLQCREAIQIDPSYRNAHCRLAKLYLRLGVAEEAVYHYKCSGHKAGPEDVGRAQDLKSCIDRCVEAKNHGDWKKLLNDSQTALSLGSDSAPKIYAMKAEALMGLHRHQEAYAVIQNTPRISIELYAGFLGSSAAAGLLEVRALVYMANGRFEDAVAAVQQALQLDSSNGVKLTAERVRDVASARLNGNKLFAGSRLSEALVSYNKGLEKDPQNSVLLCNRAACRYKLGQYEKAVEDCTAALLLCPSYTKARLRRANSNAQLEKWGAAIQDYEVLVQEIPGDEEVRAALLESKRNAQWPY